MLNRLPNELLVNILAKTKKKTICECRLLNSHFDKIITRYELDKEDIQVLTIGEVSTSGKFKIYIGNMYLNSPENCKSFESYEKFLHFVSKIRLLTNLKLSRVNINTELSNVLFEGKCFLKLKRLKVEFCQLEMNARDKWVAFLNKLQLDEFSSTDHPIPIPEMMLLRVNKIFIYRGSYDYFDMTWLDDTFLENWYSDEKNLWIRNCETSLTVNGVIKCIQKYLNNRESYELFGILMDTNRQLIEHALTEAQIEWESKELTSVIDYYITKIGDREIYAEFSCKSTENEDDMDDEDMDDEDEEEFEQNEE